MGGGWASKSDSQNDTEYTTKGVILSKDPIVYYKKEYHTAITSGEAGEWKLERSFRGKGKTKQNKKTSLFYDTTC